MALVPLLGKTVQGKNGPVDVASLSTNNDVVGIYFSAHWCPPCRAFTPKLAEFYKKLRRDGKKFEIVFVSSDKEEDSCLEYYKDMPWLLLPFSDRERDKRLGEEYRVHGTPAYYCSMYRASGIPSLVLIDAKTGKAITLEGRDVVDSDTNGDKFPWKN